MPSHLRRSEWYYYMTTSAAIASAAAIVTVSVNASAVSARCENVDGGEVWVSVRVYDRPMDVHFETQCS